MQTHLRKLFFAATLLAIAVALPAIACRAVEPPATATVEAPADKPVDTPGADSSKTSKPATAQLPPPLQFFKDRRIAPTCTDAPWLMRKERQQEEDCTRLLKALKIKPGQTVCDMGCGNGFYTLKLARVVGDEGRVLAVDVQPEMLSMLDKQLKGKHVKNVEPVLGQLNDPRLPEGKVDLILLVDVYHEFSYPDDMLKAMLKSLGPHGRIALAEFRAEDLTVPIRSEHKMSKEQIRKEFEPAGFKIVEQFDELPWQHLMFFERDEKSDER